MPFADKSITCADCGTVFTFTADEQEKFQQRGYMNEPKRCVTCRQARKQQMGGGRGGGGGGGFRGGRGGGGGGGGFGGPRESFTAICAECGKEASVPFKPRGDRPVYCSDCFRNHR